VLESKDPNRVEPVTKSTELVIVCTTNVCAVSVPATVKASAYDAVCAETAFDADCAKATNDAVSANDADATEPDSVMLPEVIILPVTVSEPDIVGELSIIYLFFSSFICACRSAIVFNNDWFGLESSILDNLSASTITASILISTKLLFSSIFSSPLIVTTLGYKLLIALCI
jgi:hypothetical protein